MIKQIPYALCSQCPLGHTFNTAVPPYGPKNPRLIVVGEGPGANEAATNVMQPFRGPAGELLRAALRQNNIDPEEVYYTNVTLCWPRGVDDKEAAMPAALEACRGRLAHELTHLPSDVPVLALGKWAQQALGLSTPERWERIRSGQWAIGGLHPAAVLYEPTQAIYLFKLIEKATRPYPFITLPTPGQALTAVDDPFPLPNLNQDLGRICLDIETTSVEWRDPQGYIFLVGILTERGDCWILTRPYLEKPETQAWLRALFTQHGHNIGGHNQKFDVLFLNREFGTPLTVGWDTICMANVLHEGWHKGLKELSTFFFNADDYEARLVKPWLGKGKTYADVPAPQMQEYLLCDLGYNLMLSFKLEDELRKVGRWEWPYLNHDLLQAELLTRIEAHGFAGNLNQVNLEITSMQADADRLKAQVVELSEGHIQNPGSTKQVATYLFDVLRNRVSHRTPKGKPSVDESSLAEYKNIPAISALISYRRVTKLKSSYLENLNQFAHQDKLGVWRVHSTYKHWNVKTHRLSAENPAIQTIPHPDERRDTLPDGSVADYGTRIKSCYVAAPGYSLVSVDGKSWELSGAAAQVSMMGLDDFLCQAFREGKDPHGVVCDMLWGAGNWTKAMRVKEKNCFFGRLYRGSAQAIAKETGLPLKDVEMVVNFLDEKLVGIRQWQDALLEQAKTGQIIIPHFGYVVHFDLITDSVLKDLPKVAVNYTNQGLCSMIMSRAAMLAQPKLTELGAFIVAMVHDSFVAEVPIGKEEKAGEIMLASLEEAGKEITDLIPWRGELEIGPNWGDMNAI